MTALAGLWRFSDGPPPPASLDAMLAAQQRYGREEARSWSEGAVALGRRLFATLPEDDPAEGPAVGAAGASVLVADVRIDNRAELAEALGIGAGEARALSDQTLLMRALERWEEEALQRIAGDFAFALWDRRRERLLLARDFAGQRPLYWTARPGLFAFASMPSGLHALAEVPRAPDRESVAAFLGGLPLAAGASHFEGVKRVPPAHLCIVTRDGVATRRWWAPEPRPLRLKRPEDYVEAVRESLDRAVADRLRRRGGLVAGHLSGGLDSSAVTATAARALAPGGPLLAYTAVPREGYDGALARGRFGDEGGHAAALAAIYPNVEHVPVRSGGRSPLAGLERGFELYQRPVLNLVNHVWLEAILDGARERGATVLLTGQMGNHTLSYSGLELLPELLARGRWLRLARTVAALRLGGVRLESAASHTIGPFLPKRLWLAANRLRGRSFAQSDLNALHPKRVAELRGRAEAAGVDLAYRPQRDPVAARIGRLGTVDWGDYNKGQLGGWGVDVRDPTGDRRLVELCLAIPAEEFLRGGRMRSIGRRVVADRAPALIAEEGRKGRQAVDWHEGLAAARDEVAEEVARAAASPAAAGIVDTQMLERLVAEWPEDDWNLGTTESRYRLALMRGLSAAHFLRRAAGEGGPANG
jgi:asparagine synthase (glutamine-hydrolysing)